MLWAMEVSTPVTGRDVTAGADGQPQTVPAHDRHPRKAINIFTRDWEEAKKIKQPGESWAQFIRLLLWFYIGAQGVAHDTPKRPALPP